ncbi:pilus assembly protein TadG-related protein [Spongiibacter taiwanensis]|uniref:pilus assembly protein TadG-related protein n=1 Tax=Spongiibacter taiwanensis TaxID=1748242 RepID=UPI0020355555|nr:pilus assembly protein TadG-related protein [Spongiibacter taiwanensis]USA43597.1 pilus assembly protein TadG-related protein [Spongiibacter taiwanensis]
MTRKKQHGAVAVMAAIMMTTLLMFLAVVVDTGRLFLERRSLQKNADLAALETALLYCRDQTMDEDGRKAVAVDVLSASRNDFKGNEGDIAVALGRTQRVSDGSGGFDRQFVADATGKAIQVTLTRTIPASLFQQLWPTTPSSISLSRSSVAQACEPTAQLSMRSNLVSVNSDDSALLNSLLGGMLGTSLALGVGDWQNLVNTDLNLLNFMDALATEMSLDVGDYDGILSTEITVGDLLDVAADVLQDGGNTAAVSALGLLSDSIPLSTPAIELVDILKIQSGAEEAALNTNVQVMELVQAAIQLANSESGLAAEIPLNLGVATAYLTLKVVEPPQFSAVGNPEFAKINPYGSDAIYVRSATVKAFASVEVPLASSLNSLLDNPLIAGVTDMVNDALSLDVIGLLTSITCLITCTEEETMVDIDILSSPRVDVLITAGEGTARVSNYTCDSTTDEKSLTSSAQSSIASVALGNMGSDRDDAAANAMASDDFTITPIPIIDIGTIEVRKTCLLGSCSYTYRSGGSWVSNKALADRDAYAGGGIAIAVDNRESPTSPATGTVLHENYPDDTYLPDIGTTLSGNAYEALGSSGVVSDVNGALTDLDLIFYEPESGGIGSNGLGTLLNLAGSAANGLTDGLTDALDAVIAPLLDSIINEILATLGASLAEVEVGGAMTCENDKVRLVM